MVLSIVVLLKYLGGGLDLQQMSRTHFAVSGRDGWRK
jgi:hypothetical protein